MYVHVYYRSRRKRRFANPQLFPSVCVLRLLVYNLHYTHTAYLLCTYVLLLLRRDYLDLFTTCVLVFVVQQAQPHASSLDSSSQQLTCVVIKFQFCVFVRSAAWTT